MESIGETLPSWLSSSPGLLGVGAVLVAVVLLVLHQRSVTVHGTLGKQDRPPPNLPEAGDAQDLPTAFEKMEQEVEAGRIIHAIKLYREETGAGLKEAKDAVERMQGVLRDVLPAAEALDARIESEVAALVADGRTIEAVKVAREGLNLSLKQAKTYVDLIRKRGMGAGA